VCFGTENGSLRCCNIIKNESIWDMKIGDVRVKCLMKVDNWLVTALSDGHISVWELNGSEKPVEICSLFLDCRVTCMTSNNYVKYSKYIITYERQTNTIANKIFLKC